MLPDIKTVKQLTNAANSYKPLNQRAAIKDALSTLIDEINSNILLSAKKGMDFYTFSFIVKADLLDLTLTEIKETIEDILEIANTGYSVSVPICSHNSVIGREEIVCTIYWNS